MVAAASNTSRKGCVKNLPVFMNQSTPHALVTGATSQIGKFLLPRLIAAGFQVTAISRYPQLVPKEVDWQQPDSSRFPLPEVLFHLAPLPLLPTWLTQLPSLKRVIAFSSTSRFTKMSSPDPQERAIAKQLAEAEQTLMTACQHRQIVWTIFRPTLVYGCGLDKNITFITHFIQRFGFFPIVGPGTGLRQPVHADDLAIACLQAYFATTTTNQSYNLSGGQTLTYKEMVTTIFHRLGKPPRILPIPLPLFKLITLSLKVWPAYAHLSTAMLARINQNLGFDHTSARQDFGYQPRPFIP